MSTFKMFILIVVAKKYLKMWWDVIWMVFGFQSYKLYYNDAPKNAFNVDRYGQVRGRIGKCYLGVCLRSDEQKITTTPLVWNFSVALKAHVLIQRSQVYSLWISMHTCIAPHFTMKSVHGHVRTYQYDSIIRFNLIHNFTC